MFSFFLAYCCLASGTEIASGNTAVDDRVRASLGIPNEDMLNEARFRDAVLKLFPFGTNWSEAERKVRRMLFPYGATRDPRRASINLHNRERHIRCEVISATYIECSFFGEPKSAAISLDDRSWHFQLRFGIAGTLQDVWTGSTSSACWQNHDPSKACLKRATDDCQSKGGIWYGHVSGLGRDTGCNLPTSDSGRPCTNKSQCEGACIPVSGSDPNSTRCICDRRMWQPKGIMEFCTENGVQRYHVE